MIVVGAGIVGLAVARAFALKGYSVVVLDRHPQAFGASIRNFGMVWPIGQPMGIHYERAMKSSRVWREIAESADLYLNASGSLHVARQDEEAAVLEEFYQLEHRDRKITLLTPTEAAALSPGLYTDTTSVALYSAEELVVDPRAAMRAMPQLWAEEWGIRFAWNQTVIEVQEHQVRTASGHVFQADLVFICSGEDFGTLFPRQFEQAPLTRCKLQMFRLAPQPKGWYLGPALCGGLSLVHYQSFAAAPSLSQLKEYFQVKYPDYLALGIHVMASEHPGRVLTVGDSHEYGPGPDPFNVSAINALVSDYLFDLVQLPEQKISETWYGVYPKMTNGESFYFDQPMPGVYLLNGLGGAGMTLSFVLAEEIAESL